MVKTADQIFVKDSGKYLFASQEMHVIIQVGQLSVLASQDQLVLK